MIKPISIPPKKLSQSITSASLSFVANNIAGWDGVDIAPADLGARHFVAFVNDLRTKLELIEIDPATIASASITILKRGLKFDGNRSTEVTANKLDWTANETTVMFGTDIPQMLAQFIDDTSDQAIGGTKSFTLVPNAAGDPVDNNDLTRKSYVLGLVLGTVTTVNVIAPGTAGATIAAGNSIYFEDATNQWKLTDATNAATINNVLLAIAQGAGTAGNPITNGVLLSGVDTHQSGLTDGQTQYASNTPGALSTSAGTIPVVLGISKGTTQLYFSPRFNQQVTQNMIDAMVGNNTDIAVGTGNKFVTQTGLQHNAEKYAADAGANDTYVIALTPAPISYTNGMIVYFKANTANTGAATINVNALGAKTIVKYVNTTLADGDIAAGMFCTLIYDGTNFVLQNPSANGFSGLFKNGTTTKNAADASTTQSIAHGLGVIPKKVKVKGLAAFSAQAFSTTAAMCKAETVYNGTTQSSESVYADNSIGQITSDTTFRLNLLVSAGADYQTGVVTFDATNIIITWTKTGSPTGTYNLLWEAEA